MPESPPVAFAKHVDTTRPMSNEIGRQVCIADVRTLVLHASAGFASSDVCNAKG